MQFGNTTSADLCNETKRIIGAPHFAPMLILQSILGLISIPPNLISLILIWKVNIFDINLRILLAHFTFHLLWLGGGQVVRSVRMLRHTFADPCSLITSASRCRMQDLFTSSKASATFALLSLLIERCYATIRYQSYEKKSRDVSCRKPWSAFVLIISSWIFFVYVLLVTGTTIDRLLPICESLMSLNANSAKQATIVNLTAESMALGLTLFVYFYNRYLQRMAINCAKYTLNCRYQIDQNIQINRILVPSMILHLACYMPNFIFLFLLLVELETSEEMKTWLIHLYYILKLVHTTAHPLLSFYRNPHMRKQFLKCVPLMLMLKKRKRVGPAIEPYIIKTDAHFEMLEKMWSAKGGLSKF